MVETLKKSSYSKGCIAGNVLNGKPVLDGALTNAFNKYFIGLVHNALSVNSRSINTHTVESCFFLPTNESEVVTFANIADSKAVNINRLKLIPVKYVIDLIAPILTCIFNLIFPTSTISTRWRLLK